MCCLAASDSPPGMKGRRRHWAYRYKYHPTPTVRSVRCRIVNSLSRISLRRRNYSHHTCRSRHTFLCRTVPQFLPRNRCRNRLLRIPCRLDMSSARSGRAIAPATVPLVASPPLYSHPYLASDSILVLSSGSFHPYASIPLSASHPFAAPLPVCVPPVSSSLPCALHPYLFLPSAFVPWVASRACSCVASP